MAYPKEKNKRRVSKRISKKTKGKGVQEKTITKKNILVRTLPLIFLRKALISLMRKLLQTMKNRSKNKERYSLAIWLSPLHLKILLN